MVFDLIKTTNDNIEKNKIKTDSDIRNAKSFTVNFSKEMHQQIFNLHQFLSTYFYTNSNIARMDKKSQKIVEDLFNVFMDDYKLLPKTLRFDVTNNISDKDKANHICTYIANMTDAMAVEEHQKLFNISYRF